MSTIFPISSLIWIILYKHVVKHNHNFVFFSVEGCKGNSSWRHSDHSYWQEPSVHSESTDVCHPQWENVSQCKLINFHNFLTCIFLNFV